MSREAHVRICERLGMFVPGRLDCASAFLQNMQYLTLLAI